MARKVRRSSRPKAAPGHNQSPDADSIVEAEFIETDPQILARRNEALKGLQKFTGLYDATKGGTDATPSETEELARVAGDTAEVCAQELQSMLITHDRIGAAFLWVLILAVSTMGSIKNPVAKAWREKSIAYARQSIEAKSKDIDKTILELAEPVWKRKPSSRKSAGKTAAEIAESVNDVLGYPLGVSAIEKRLRRLMKPRTTEQSSD